MYWQSIIVRILVVLKQGGDVAILRDSTVAGLNARRDINALASRCEYPSVHHPLLNVP